MTAAFLTPVQLPNEERPTKALCRYGTNDIRCDTVPDPTINAANIGITSATYDIVGFSPIPSAA